MHACVPYYGDLRWGINALQLDNYITYGMNYDTAFVQNPARFMELIDEKTEQFIQLGQADGEKLKAKEITREARDPKNMPKL